jgi:hypothetical protein
MQGRIVDAKSLDIDRHVLLLSRSFGQSAWAAQIGATLTRDFYIWKYFSPAGHAVISSVLVEGEVVSSVSAFPTLFQTPSGVRKGWQIGDIATLPSARGKGLYRRSLSGLVERLGGEMLICFPNANSRREIESQGFRFATEVRTFVRPLNPFAARPAVARSASNPWEFVVPVSADRSDRYSFFKNHDYLEWRYQKNPACRYDVITSDRGYCVLRSFSLFGVAVGIVMEVAADTGRTSCELMRETERLAAGKGMRANFIMTSSPLVRGLRTGYAPVPRLVLPKRQALFVRTPGPMASSMQWDIQIGDWDGL